MLKIKVVIIILVIVIGITRADWVTTTIPVGVEPQGIAINPATNKIYVVDVMSDSMTIIDGVTNTTTKVMVGDSACNIAVNPVTNKIYVTDHSDAIVTVIDGATNSTTTIPAGDEPWCVAVNSVTNKIYVNNFASDNVTVIDGATNDTTLVMVGNGPNGIAVNPVTNKIYVSNRYSTNVTEIDGATNSTQTISVGSIYWLSGIAVNPVTNKIYVVNQDQNRLTVIDGATHSTQNISVGSFPDWVAVNPVTNKIYVTNRNSDNVTVVDGATHSTQTVSVGDAPVKLAINAITNKIYVTNSLSNNITVIDGSTNNTTTLSVGTSPYFIVANPVTNKIYAGNRYSGNVTVIDGSSNTTTTVPVGNLAHDVAVNPITNKIYCLGELGNNITIIDGITNQTVTVPVGTNPRAVQVNPITNKIYVANWGSDNLTIIDGVTNIPDTTISVGDGPADIRINLVTNKIYIANWNSNDVTILNGETNETINISVGTLPRSLAVNPVTNKIYVTIDAGDSVCIIDGATNQTKMLPAGDGPFMLCINIFTNRIYVTNVWSANVTVIDGNTDLVIATVPARQWPREPGVNPYTNKIYVACQGDPRLIIIDGATNDTSSVLVGNRANLALVNPITNKIYVVNENSNSVTVIDGATNSTSTVTVGSAPGDAALNPVTNKIYISNRNSNNVTVITDVFVNDTKVRTVIDTLLGDTTCLPQPNLTGKGVNRSDPNSTNMMGVLNRVGTAQLPWNWAQVTSGSGTDSIHWAWQWNTDSLLMGENFVCAVPLEDNAAITNNHGQGTPFTGNLEVYPVYRLGTYNIPPNTWQTMASIPSSPSGKMLKSGSCMAGLYVTGLIYFLKASNRPDFYSYTPDFGIGTWTILDTIPKGDKALGDGKYPKRGAAMAAYEPGKRVYVLRGNNRAGFWAYQADNLGDTIQGWYKLANIPEGAKRPKYGTGLVHVTKGGKDYLFCMKGAKTNEFYLYDIETNTWLAVSSPPTGMSGKAGYKKGSCLAYDGSEYVYVLQGYYGSFFCYKVEADSWFELKQYDYKTYTNRDGKKKKPKDGASLVYYDNNVYMLKGGNTVEVWKYDITLDEWSQMSELWDIPLGTSNKKVKDGGAMIKFSINFYASKGKNTPEFYRHIIPTTKNIEISNILTNEVTNGKKVDISNINITIAPHPINKITTLRFNLPAPSPVNYKLYNISGELVKFYTNSTLVKDGMILIDAKTLNSGIYFLHFYSGDMKATRKLVINN